MAELKITDLVDESQIQAIKNLAGEIETAKNKYTEAAKELAKGLKINVEVVGDLDKLNALVSAQSKKAAEGTDILNDALKKQAELSQQVADKLENMAKSSNLSAKDAKTLADATQKNAAALEKQAKAEAAAQKAMATHTKAKKAANLTEEERKKLIQDAIELSGKEVHSISEANEANKKLREAVKVLKDTDEDYTETLGKLNSTIGVNTDYVKRNSDRYTQQKMTIGNYKEEIKAAYVELKNGNNSMKNMGIIAQNTGKILNTSFRNGITKATSQVGVFIKGMVGAQAIMKGASMLFNKIKEGFNVAKDFQKANSTLAAVLGKSPQQTKALQVQARELGATTQYTAAQATELQVELAKLGFTFSEIQNSTPGILKFAQATGSELAEAASLAGASLRMFNADTKETDRYVSAMAISTSKSALSFSYLATALPIVGPVAKAFNFTIEDTLALLGKLADSGFDASMAATATRNIFLNLADSSGKLSKQLGKPVKTLPDLVKGLKKLKEQGVDLNTTLELTDKRSVAAFNAFLTSADKIETLRESITGVESDLDQMASTMTDNTAGAIKENQSAWEELMITIYKNTGAVRAFVEVCTEGIRMVTALFESAGYASEKAAARAEMVGSKAGEEALERQKKDVENLKKSYMKAGLDEEEALKKAKERKIAILQSQLDQEIKLRDEYTRKNEELRKQKEDASFWKQGLGMEKTNAEYDKEIQQTFEDYITQLSYIKSLETQIQGISVLGLDNNGSGKSTIETEEQKKARIKAEQDTQDAIISAMDEGLEKQILTISQSYEKKLAAIKGNTKAETDLRIALGQQMQKEIKEATDNYMKEGLKEELNVRLELAQKGSEEELNVRLQLLDIQHEEEIKKALEKGISLNDVEEKFQSEREKILEEHASAQIAMIAENAAYEQRERERMYTQSMTELKEAKASGLISDVEYEERSYQVTLDYLQKTTEATIDALEQELLVENLTAKERERIANELADKKIELAKKVADYEINAGKKIDKADEKSSKDRIKNAQEWLRMVSDTVGAIGDLVGTLYDAKLDKLDEESEANQDAHDRELERIQELEENGAITKEEAEARKRASEDRTAQKEAELEKKRRKMQYKQAVWEKATSLAQTGIQTALGIMATISKLGFPAAIPFVAMVAALGAIQAATIIATPIPKYAKGTKDHPGGMAVVGDAGKSEAVVTEDGIWKTPSVPTLVDLPKHAVVYPDAEKLPESITAEMSKPFMFSERDKGVTVVNDYSRLEKKMDKTNTLLSEGFKEARKRDAERDLSNYMEKNL